LFRQLLKPLFFLAGRMPGKVLGWQIRLAGMLAPNAFTRSIALEFDKLYQEGHCITQLSRKAMRQLNARCCAGTMINFFIRFYSYGAIRREEFRKKGIPVPVTYLLSPTMRCNLHCGGCYAGMYNPEDDLEIEVIDRVMSEAKEMGLYVVFILGGEPFIRQDMLDIYRKHGDVYFYVFTNGTLINAELAKKLARLGNVVPLLSIEGFEKETDARRGKGVFQKIMQAMDNLREEGVPFGFSAMVTRFNVDRVLSDEFNDMLINKGCLLGWHFLYIPMGRKPNPRLMPTPEQRLMMYEKGARMIRAQKPLLLIDFWNDAPYTGGCIAGAQHFFHINAHGDVEPCIFIHYAVDNVKEKSLKECLKSPFFKAFRERQPYSPNLLRPCAILDHPHVLREILAEFQPYPTHPDSEVLVTTLHDHLDQYAEKAAQLLDPVWERDFASRGFECHYFASIIKATRELYHDSVRSQRSGKL